MNRLSQTIALTAATLALGVPSSFGVNVLVNSDFSAAGTATTTRNYIVNPAGGTQGTGASQVVTSGQWYANEATNGWNVNTTSGRLETNYTSDPTNVAQVAFQIVDLASLSAGGEGDYTLTFDYDYANVSGLGNQFNAFVAVKNTNVDQNTPGLIFQGLSGTTMGVVGSFGTEVFGPAWLSGAGPDGLGLSPTWNVTAGNNNKFGDGGFQMFGGTFSGTGTVGFSLDAATIGTLDHIIVGFQFQPGNAFTDGRFAAVENVVLDFVAVPEPTVWALMGLAGFGALALRRRRA